jgi:NADP-dependent 3-hydroxy acid dehydrogenase YdfG
MASSASCVLITGASSGIGESTALACAQAGMNLALVGRSAQKLEAVAQAARALGVTAKSYEVDLAQVERVQPAIATITQDWDAIDVLINNAGSAYVKDLIDMPVADWQNLLNVNLTAAFQCVQAVLPGMRSRHHGTIINVISVAGRQVFPGWGAYCVSKFGLMALSKTLAIEERPHGIRVVALCPGAVNTPLWEHEAVSVDFDRTAMLAPETVAESILYILKLPEQAVVEELVLMPQGGTL